MFTFVNVVTLEIASTLTMRVYVSVRGVFNNGCHVALGRKVQLCLNTRYETLWMCSYSFLTQGE